MRRNGTVIGSIILAIVCLSAAAAEPPAFTGKISPFAYCASVGTTDGPAGTTGPSAAPPGAGAVPARRVGDAGRRQARGGKRLLAMHGRSGVCLRDRREPGL